jgi:hypothetical protein
MVAFPKPLFEEDGDIVRDTLEILVAVGLCCFDCSSKIKLLRDVE